MYASAVEYAVATHQIDNITKNVTGKFTTEDGITLTGDTTLIVGYDGDVVCEIIKINVDGTLYLAACQVSCEIVNYTYGEKQSYDNGDIIYFDITTGKVCASYHENNSLPGYNGIYEGETSTSTTENQNGCLKFYAFNDDVSLTINLILDHNTDASVVWNSNGITKSCPTEVLSQLQIDTFSWEVIEQPKNYISCSKGYIIDYSRYNARLITTNEIVQIVEYTEWDEKTIGSNFQSHIMLLVG